MRIEEPMDWLPEMFRNMNYRDEDGVLHKIDWSVPGGRWVPVESQGNANSPHSENP